MSSSWLSKGQKLNNHYVMAIIHEAIQKAGTTQDDAELLTYASNAVSSLVSENGTLKGWNATFYTLDDIRMGNNILHWWNAGGRTEEKYEIAAKGLRDQLDRWAKNLHRRLSGIVHQSTRTRCGSTASTWPTHSMRHTLHTLSLTTPLPGMTSSCSLTWSKSTAATIPPTCSSTAIVRPRMLSGLIQSPVLHLMCGTVLSDGTSWLLWKPSRSSPSRTRDTPSFKSTLSLWRMA
ncbi:hypothetical protein SNOG_07191 [Parastagonospora nodorum SN15]|uniref:Uncharacterized protein n=1 Tax=Phaeosphaeria nodorum (strain SN15 / ATCC MYA-4574 / FGSC 10173) TaxID=321614 RepID=Q0UM23_PHANO|nr:hypothetical protein SNOG_07191 [Parastagonospora nodorum SN15]EAT85842.2 hypothetical protein SNOG_07191 [Parastagonospora nodorum SN15]